MRVLLDTQVLIHAYIGDVPLSSRAQALLGSPETVRYLSAVSIMEVALKHNTGKLKMGAAEMRQAIYDIRLQVIPFGPNHALQLYGLAQHHRDQFDRMLIATALTEGMALVGSERLFRKYKGLQVIW